MARKYKMYINCWTQDISSSIRQLDYSTIDTLAFYTTDHSQTRSVDDSLTHPMTEPMMSHSLTHSQSQYNCKLYLYYYLPYFQHVSSPMYQ